MRNINSVTMMPRTQREGGRSCDSINSVFIIDEGEDVSAPSSLA
jgi:hypothetical protein